MSDAKSGSFPRRDADGRINTLADLLGVTLAGLVVGLLTLVLFEWTFALIGLGKFGRANGWLAVLLPAWLFVEEFRAWRFGAARVVAALVAGGLGVVIGLLAAGLAHDLPPLVSGAAAAAAFTVSYAVIWFYGVRWLTRRTG
jgi:hypothetical protein